ncbi:MAG TPA: hypothetical protein VJQ44_11035 [Gemmatimonadales bacterium]|nr:hypothetical protein [Gemmatimonadales bacterium]
MRTIAVCGLALTFLPAAAAAQNDCLKDFKMPAVGAWAEYTGTYNGKPTTMRYAVVGSESRDGKDLKWLEMRVEGGKTMVYQMLTPGTPAEMGQVEDMVFKEGDKPAMRMNSMMVGMIRGQMKKSSVLSNLCEGVTNAGEETVEVPAGSFKSTKLHNEEDKTDTWVTSKVPFYMVKSVGKDYNLSLAKVGDGAKSSITETPQEMPGMGAPKKNSE